MDGLIRCPQIAMHLPRPATSPRLRLLWLLWLVLLLPIAQTSAALHGLSHALSDRTGENPPIDGKQAVQHAHCDLCLTAAALVGAAPPVAPPFLPRLAALHEPPHAVRATAWVVPTLPAYESRAPPFSLL